MGVLDQFNEEQRKVLVQEIELHKVEAYAAGFAEGRRQAGPMAIATWLKSAWESWTMRAGAGALALGVAADVWPVAAELLGGRIDPKTLTLIGAVVMALRSRSVSK